MRLTNTIHQLTIPFKIPLSPEKSIDRFVNVFIIEGEKIHLIDSGVIAAFPIIKGYLHNIGRSFSEVENILLTHSHPDHIGSAGLIKKETFCKVWAHPAEKDWIENTELQFSLRPVPGFFQLVSGPVKVDKLFNDGENIELEEKIHLKVIHTPGHSRGSVSFYFEEEKVLFSGDAVLLPGEMPIYEDVEAYLKSLSKIESVNAEELLSAWDNPRIHNEITIVIKQSEKYIRKIQEAVEKLAQNEKNINSMEFCAKVLDYLGLPAFLANPLLLKSFLANKNYSKF